MSLEDIKDKIIYSKLSKVNPINPLLIWWDTNRDLDKFYKRPDINLNDASEDLIKKNAMRHIVGSARLGQLYSNPSAIFIDGVKETFDYAKDFLNPKSLGVVSQSVKDDTTTDWNNNFLGINYTDKYPNATKEDILQYAWGLANGAKPIGELPQSKLYGYITNTEE